MAPQTPKTFNDVIKIQGSSNEESVEVNSESVQIKSQSELSELGTKFQKPKVTIVQQPPPKPKQYLMYSINSCQVPQPIQFEQEQRTTEDHQPNSNQAANFVFPFITNSSYPVGFKLQEQEMNEYISISREMTQ